MNQTDLAVIIPTLKSKVDYPPFLDEHRIILSSSPGRGRARNQGAMKADSTYLLFIDDDASFSEETYKKYILDVLINNPDVVVSYRGEVILCTRVMGISRDLFFKLGGFDETFITAEDQDFGYRVIQNGYKIGYIPSELVIHKEHPIPKGFRILIGQHKNRIRLMVRYRKLIKWDRHKKCSIIIPVNILNCFRLFIGRRIKMMPISVIISMFGFFYYLFFDRMKLINKTGTAEMRERT